MDGDATMSAHKDEMKQQRCVFDLFDQDKNGSIDLKELTTKMGSLGFMLDATELKDMIKDADENGNGTIEFAEFVKLLKMEMYMGFATRMLQVNTSAFPQCCFSRWRVPWSRSLPRGHSSQLR